MGLYDLGYMATMNAGDDFVRISEDGGKTWREVPTLRSALASVLATPLNPPEMLFEGLRGVQSRPAIPLMLSPKEPGR